MPNPKKIQTPYVTGKTVYAIIRREVDGYFLNDADGGFATAPVDPYLALTEHATMKGLYETSESRMTWTDGRYIVLAYEQAGGSPAPTSDTVIASGEMKVGGDVEVERITLSEIEGSAVLAKQAKLDDLHDEAFGKWNLDPTAKTLTLYKSDGATVLKTFNLTTTPSTVPAFIRRTPA